MDATKIAIRERLRLNLIAQTYNATKDLENKVADFFGCALCGQIGWANVRDPEPGEQAGPIVILKKVSPDGRQEICSDCNRMLMELPLIANFIVRAIKNHEFQAHGLDNYNFVED